MNILINFSKENNFLGSPPASTKLLMSDSTLQLEIEYETFLKFYPYLSSRDVYLTSCSKRSSTIYSKKSGCNAKKIKLKFIFAFTMFSCKSKSMNSAFILEAEVLTSSGNALESKLYDRIKS